MSDRLEELRRKLAARHGQPGYAANVAAIEAEIARLEAEARRTETADKLGIATDG